MEIISFARLPAPDFARWRAESGESPSRHWEKVDARGVDAASVTLMALPYVPYLPTDEGVELSAFYVASNRLHAAAGKNALNMPLKPLAAGFGIGAYGRNGVLSIPGLGTRFALAAVASEEAPDPAWEWNDSRPLARKCENCRACVDACPSSALRGDGRLETDMCVRAQAQYQEPPMPDSSKSLVGPSAWGCEICQNVCPRNAPDAPVSMPEELKKALELRRLLAGDVKALGEWIGSNYARPARMQARACIVAANLGRHDLTGEIARLLKSPVKPVRECAQWAVDRLQNGGI